MKRAKKTEGQVDMSRKGKSSKKDSGLWNHWVVVSLGLFMLGLWGAVAYQAIHTKPRPKASVTSGPVPVFFKRSEDAMPLPPTVDELVLKSAGRLARVTPRLAVWEVPSHSILCLALVASSRSIASSDLQPLEWAREADRMIQLDSRSEEQITALMNFSQRHHFWKKNICSMGALRKQFDRLTLERSENTADNASSTHSLPTPASVIRKQVLEQERASRKSEEVLA